MMSWLLFGGSLTWMRSASLASSPLHARPHRPSQQVNCRPVRLARWKTIGREPSAVPGSPGGRTMEEPRR